MVTATQAAAAVGEAAPALCSWQPLPQMGEGLHSMRNAQCPPARHACVSEVVHLVLQPHSPKEPPSPGAGETPSPGQQQARAGPVAGGGSWPRVRTFPCPFVFQAVARRLGRAGQSVMLLVQAASQQWEGQGPRLLQEGSPQSPPGPLRASEAQKYPVMGLPGLF